MGFVLRSTNYRIARDHANDFIKAHCVAKNPSIYVCFKRACDFNELRGSA